LHHNITFYCTKRQDLFENIFIIMKEELKTLNRTIFKYKGKTISKLNRRSHNLRDIVESLVPKGIYCQIDRVCEYEFDTYVYLTIAKNAKQQTHVLDLAGQFDAAIRAKRTRLPIYKIDSNAS